MRVEVALQAENELAKSLKFRMQVMTQLILFVEVRRVAKHKLCTQTERYPREGDWEREGTSEKSLKFVTSSAKATTTQKKRESLMEMDDQKVSSNQESQEISSPRRFR